VYIDIFYHLGSCQIFLLSNYFFSYFYVDKICKIKLQGKYRKIILVNVHAPQKIKLEVKYEFYDEVGEVWQKIRKYDVKILIGDMNAKIGKEYEVSNENRKVIIQFAEENNIKIKSRYL
jgi:exonuclease III